MFELKHPPGDSEASADTLRLSCTRGEPAPQGLASDALSILGLPDAVKARFGEIVRPYLHGQPDEEQARALEAICQESDLDPQRLVPAIKAARFLITAAAHTAQSRDGFTEDLARLDDDPRAIRQLVEVLLPTFEAQAPVLRRRSAEQTLADHGKLVEETHWRVDSIVCSDHGDGLNLPVAVVTFVYREGERRERITMQLLPEQLNALKQACLHLLPDSPEG